MSIDLVVTRKVGSVLWAEIHNPHVNFLTVDILCDLWEVVRKVRDDDSVRVLVLTGGIEDTYIMHFSIPELLRIAEENATSPVAALARFPAGRALLQVVLTANNVLMDRFPAVEELNLAVARALRGRMFTLLLWLQMHRLYRAIERLDKVTIAAINGHCNGGGSELSACFDFRFMVGNCGFTIGQPEVLVGIIPGGGGSQRWPRLIGKAKALEWLLRGNQLDPQEARELGIITDVFDRAVFAQRVQEFAEVMATRPPVAVGAIKRAVHGGSDSFLARGLTMELLESLRVFDTRDVERGMGSYARLLQERVDVPPGERIAPDELFGILNEAGFFEGFEGK